MSVVRKQVSEAAFLAVKKASEVIDMSKHHGEHPRMGATDVCPLVPVSGITMEETAEYARKLAKRIGEELKFLFIVMKMLHSKRNGETWQTAGRVSMKDLKRNLQILNGNLISDLQFLMKEPGRLQLVQEIFLLHLM